MERKDGRRHVRELSEAEELLYRTHTHTRTYHLSRAHLGGGVHDGVSGRGGGQHEGEGGADGGRQHQVERVDLDPQRLETKVSSHVLKLSYIFLGVT